MVDICNVPGAAQTNATSLSTVKECDPGENSVWTYWEPNEISDFSAALTKEARDPISRNRGGGKPQITALEAAPGFQHDLTASFFDYFMDDFLFTTWQGTAAQDFNVTAVTAVTASAFTLDPAAIALPEGAVVYARGFDNEANNGRHVVGAMSTTTSVPVSGLTADASPGDDVSLHHVGHEFAAGEISIDAAGNIVSSTTDLTTLGYVVDQWIDVRGFTDQPNTLARIVEISATQLTLANSLLTEDAGTGVTATIYISQLAKTVPVGDPLFRQPQLTAEVRYNSATPEYEYGRRLQANQITLNLPVAAKSTCDVTFSGADVEPPTTTRRAGSWTNPLLNDAFAPAAASRRVAVEGNDESELTTFLKDVTITINNNGGGEAVWGDLAATFATFGNQTIESSTEAVFTDGSVLRAARNNATIQMSLAMFNEQATVVFHQPDSTWDEPGKNFERDNTVKVSGTIRSFTDPLNYRFSASLFWWLPTPA